MTTIEMSLEQFMKLSNGFRDAPPDSVTIAVCVPVLDQFEVGFVKDASDMLTYPDDTLIIIQERVNGRVRIAELTVRQYRVQMSRKLR